MAQIFISYKSSERAEISRIASGIEAEGFSVWWDFSLRGGQDYSQVIDGEIANAKVVMPIWSRDSIKSRWVSAEAERGWDKLFPVCVDDVQPPLPYNKLHTLELIGWNGDRSDPRWRRMIADLQAIISGTPFAPVQTLTLGAARAGKKARRAVIFTGWVAAAAAIAALGVVSASNLAALRATLGFDAHRETQAPATPSSGEAAAQSIGPPSTEAAAAAESAAPPAPTSGGAAPERGIRTYADAVSAIRATGSQVSLEICVGASQCGASQVRVGEVIKVRVTSQVSGRLILLDQDANGAQVQLFPNGLSRAGSAMSLRAGQSIELPMADHGFVFGVSEPAGASKLIALVIPDAAPLPVIVAENTRERGIQAVPSERRDEFASTATALSQSNDLQRAAIGEMSYLVVR